MANGYCFAGNAALFGCSDFRIATKNSWIGMAGPAMIEGGGLGIFDPEENNFNLDMWLDSDGKEIKKIRDGTGPRLVEIYTFRYMQHVGPGTDIGIGGRTQQSLDDWEVKDPLLQTEKFETALVDVEQELDEAIEFAESSQFPRNNDLLKDVY